MVTSITACTLLLLGPTKKTSPMNYGRLPRIAKELIARTKKDQDARFYLMSLKDQKAIMKAIPEMVKIDVDNTKWMHQIVDKYGWPSNSFVGPQASGDAWLLVQHADKDKLFQRRCLNLILPYMDKGEASKQNVALLIDRVLVGEGKNQLYGSQWSFKNGDVVPSTPIADEATVEKRRAAMNLIPLQQYKDLLKKMYANQIANSAKSK
jgi:hypothetical protein